MTRRLVVAVGVAFTFLAGCGRTTAAQPRVVVVTDASVKSAATTGDNMRLVVTLTMRSSVDDELIGASVPATVAAKATVEGTAGGTAGHLGHLDAPGAPAHTHTTIDRIKLPKGVAVQLKAGVGRILLEQVVTPIRTGDQFPLTLRFATGATQTVTVVSKVG
jgi:copper(I)-binding protein